MDQLTELKAKLQAVRESLDSADKCEFGRLNKLLDRMAGDTDDAIRIAESIDGTAHTE